MLGVNLTRAVVQEDAMAILVKQTQHRFVRWFKKIKKNNDSPSKWYERENCGVH